MQHTREPWKVVVRGTVPLIIAGNDIRMPIAIVQEVYMRRDVRRANARRIVACVNFCKSISTEELENTGFPRLTSAPSATEG